MSRTKQINVTIPKDKMQMLLSFDAIACAAGITRSALILQLMGQHIIDNPAEDSPPTELPEWLL